jgi:hypothetical protein
MLGKFVYLITVNVVLVLLQAWDALGRDRKVEYQNHGWYF